MSCSCRCVVVIETVSSVGKVVNLVVEVEVLIVITVVVECTAAAAVEVTGVVILL